MNRTGNPGIERLSNLKRKLRQIQKKTWYRYRERKTRAKERHTEKNRRRCNRKMKIRKRTWDSGACQKWHQQIQQWQAMKALKNKIKVEGIIVKDDKGNFVKGDEKSAEMII